ncbi:MAG: ArnT family glycosyltransferase [Planctomycetota bacterium]
MLNTAALDWGQTGDVSWSPDTIEGRITVIYLPQLFKRWTHKYPRGHYLVSALFYKPMIAGWESSPVTVRTPDGRILSTPLNEERLYQLASVSRKISILMAGGVLLGIFLTARNLLKDDLAAILACLCMSLCCLFLFYSKSACVDVPAFFWFVWAGCFGLYAIKTDKLVFYLLAGFCAGWSVCTKEGVATFLVGLAAGLATLLVRQKVKSGQSLPKASLSLVHWKVLAGIVLAVLIFITLEGFWGGMAEWHYRSGNWNNVIENQFKSQGLSTWNLVVKTYGGLTAAWGRPFTILLLGSVLYWLIRYRWELCLTLSPFLVFFLLTVMIIRFNLPRFMMCGFAGMAIIMGKTIADWVRFKKIPIVVRYAMPLLVFVPSLTCCICYNLEMKHDTRIQAERWMAKNAAPGSFVGLSMTRNYGPRLWRDGFRMIPQWDSKGIDTPNGKMQVWPDYIIGSSASICRSKTDTDFFNKLFKGETKYEKQADFNRLYFNPQKPIWKYCLRFYNLHGFISPPMMIYKQ